MVLLQALLKFSTIGVLLSLILLMLKEPRKTTPIKFGIGLAISLICLFLSTGDPSITIQEPWVIALRLIDLNTFLFAWWFGLALFDDEFRLSWQHYLVAAIYLIASATYRLSVYEILSYSPDWLAIAVSVLGVGMMSHLAYESIQGRREDLVESRRKMRLRFTFGIVFVIISTVLLERLAEPLFEGALKLLVDDLAHLVELPFVAAAELLKAAVDRFLKVLEATLVRLGQGLELHGEGLELRGLRLADLADGVDEGRGAGLMRARDLFA